MRNLALKPRFEYDNIDTAGGYGEKIVTKETAHLAGTVIAKATENAIRVLEDDTTVATYDLAVKGTEGVMKEYLSLEPSSIPNDRATYAMAMRGTEGVMKEYFGKMNA